MKPKRCVPWIRGENMGTWDTDELFGPWPLIDPLKISDESILVVKRVAKTICDQLRSVIIAEYLSGRVSQL